jgi:predicted DNA-binding transcriptional regulator YafY
MSSLQSTRSARLIRLTATICARRTFDLADVTRDFQVTRRTAMRDLRSLREAGLHIIFFPQEGRYRLVELDFL